MIFWDDTAAAARPRLIENFLKTAAATGVPLANVGMCLRSDITANRVSGSTRDLVAKAVEMHVGCFLGSSVETRKNVSLCAPPSQLDLCLDRGSAANVASVSSLFGWLAALASASRLRSQELNLSDLDTTERDRRDAIPDGFANDGVTEELLDRQSAATYVEAELASLSVRS